MDDLIEQGAESKIHLFDYFDNQTIIKERFKKNYRHKLLNERLTKERIRAEVRALIHLKFNCPMLSPILPTIYFVNDTDIIMTRFVDFQTLCRIINDDSLERKIVEDCLSKIGQIIGEIHKNGIIHGDLTTTNFLISLKEKKIVPIDFGLACFSTSTEDRAVDLYVLERSLLTSRPDVLNNFNIILKSYSSQLNEEGPNIISKLEQVRARGRKRLIME